MKYTLGLVVLFVAACDTAALVVNSNNERDDVALCWDYNPCSFDFYSDEYGCTYEQMPDSVSCFGDFGIGICADGKCVKASCDSGSHDLLQGTCKLGQCINGLYRIVPKVAGVPCVLPLPVGDPPWVEGTCDGEGTCI